MLEVHTLDLIRKKKVSEIVKRFWNELRIWLSNNSTVTIELGEKQILFAFQDKRNTLRN